MHVSACVSGLHPFNWLASQLCTRSRGRDLVSDALQRSSAADDWSPPTMFVSHLTARQRTREAT